jgi:uncharacterized coiled-coil protein SlyX
LKEIEKLEEEIKKHEETLDGLRKALIEKNVAFDKATRDYYKNKK